MNSEPGAVRKWKLADISRVVVDGEEVDVKQRANEFVREDGQPVQLVLEFREDLLPANARRTARRSRALRPAGAAKAASPSPRSSLGLPWAPVSLVQLTSHYVRRHWACFRRQARQNVPPEHLGRSGQDAAGGLALLSILDEAISETRRESY